MKRFLVNQKGFTFIEMIIVIAVFSILTINISTLLVYTININKKLSQKNINLENATLAMEFILSQVQTAEKYKTENWSRFLTVDNGKNVSYFNFYRNINLIEFGNNALAENVKDISINIDNDIMTIQLEMVGEIKLVGQISVKYKSELR